MERIFCMKKLLGRALCAVVCGGILAIAGNAGPVIPVSAAEGKVCNVNDYKGSGSVAIQNAINACPEGGTVYIPAGTYRMVTTVTLKSNITLKGDGDKTILEVNSLLSTGANMMKSSDPPVGLNNYGDENITLRDITFTGKRASGRTGSLLGLTKAQNVTIVNCTFKENPGITLGLGGCKNVLVKDCIFEDNGLTKPSKISSPALWVDRTMGTPAINITVEDSIFRNNNWSGCYFMPQGGKIARCTFINNGESSIYTNQYGSDIQYIDNYIDGARSSNISASGLETCASNVLIEGNLIKNSGNEGISLTNQKNVIVRNNMILNNGQEKEKFSNAAGIMIYSLGLVENYYVPQDITITGNIIANRPGMEATQGAGVALWRHSAGEPVERLTISNNIFGEFPYGTVRFIGDKSMIIGSGYSFKGNKESQTVTMKTEEDFVKALNERIRKARETATTAKPGPSTTGAGTTMPGKTQTPAGSSPAAAGSSSVPAGSTAVSSGSAGTPDSSGTIAAGSTAGYSDTSANSVPADVAPEKGMKPWIITLLILLCGGAIGTGAVFIVKKRKNTPEPTDQQEP